jgi:hypothetical protein
MGAGGSLKQPLIKFRLFLFFVPPVKDAAVQVYEMHIESLSMLGVAYAAIFNLCASSRKGCG